MCKFDENIVVLDAKSLVCPLPLLKTKQALAKMSNKQVLRVETSDQGSAKDIPDYIALTKHQLLQQYEENDHIIFMIEKNL